ncbi:MAG: uncharacterized protein A8A55_1913 [Amphiamblys sp. WSBS2006]|nr:MAG: uncharacterized protein A8A55_1913 [Amphiamblys sp. WSBS2006]
MENLQEQTAVMQDISFARYKNKYFVERNEGLLIIPNVAYEHPEEVKAIQESLFKLKQEVLEASGRTDADAQCMICCEGSKEGKILFPTCREPHHLFVCLDCLKKEDGRGTERIVCPHDREDPFAMTEYRRIVSEQREAFRNQREEFLSRMATQPTTHTPSVFSMKTTTIPDEKTFLTEQTTVSLENVAISEGLFFVLLSKTKVRVGDNFSLFGNKNGEDCIKEHGMERYTSVFLKKEQSEPITPLFLENINNIPSNSIGCTLGIPLFNISTRLLTKLIISERCLCESLSLEMEKEEHLREILAMENKSFFIGKRIIIKLKGYAHNILPKLAFHKDNEIGRLSLEMKKEEHLGGILAMEDESFFVLKPKTIILGGYAVNILPKINFRENRETHHLELEADQEEHVTTILGVEDESFFVVKMETITLRNYAVAILPKLSFREDKEMDGLYLSADLEEHATTILGMDGGSIFVGKTKKILFEKYATNILPKLAFHEDNEMDVFSLEDVEKEECIRAILDMEDRSIFVKETKIIKLREYAVNILPKLVLRGRTETKGLYLSAYLREYIAPILAREQTFCPGSMKEMGLCNYAIFVLVKMDMTKGNCPRCLKLSIGWVYRPGMFREYENNIFLGGIEELNFEGYTLELLVNLRRRKKHKEIRTIYLHASKADHITQILNTKNRSIDIEGVNTLKLRGYAVNVLPKLKIRENNEMESFFVWSYYEDSMANILKMKNKSIEIGRIKKKGFDVPEEIEQKLKYILVDEEGHEIVEKKTEEGTGDIVKEETKKRSFPSRVLKKILGRGSS